MTSEKRSRVLYVLVPLALAITGACSSAAKESDDGVEVTTTTVKPAGMTFEECQKSAEYPGGRYAVDYDNGVCHVQKPAGN